MLNRVSKNNKIEGVEQAVAYIKPRACLRAHTLPMNHKEFEIYV